MLMGLLAAPQMALGQDPCDGLGGDGDGDGICTEGGAAFCTGGATTDCKDNCPTIPNADQDDTDADGVGQVCDNCLSHFNPRLASPLAFQNTTGGQLDQDMDGNGNRCDGRFFGFGTFVLPADVAAFKQSVGKLRTLNVCGTPSASSACAEYDLDGVGPIILPADVSLMKSLVGKPIGPKCAACPLP
jgi:hypothetical protein